MDGDQAVLCAVSVYQCSPGGAKTFASSRSLRTVGRTAVCRLQ